MQRKMRENTLFLERCRNPATIRNQVGGHAHSRTHARLADFVDAVGPASCLRFNLVYEMASRVRARFTCDTLRTNRQALCALTTHNPFCSYMLNQSVLHNCNMRILSAFEMK